MDVSTLGSVPASTCHALSIPMGRATAAPRCPLLRRPPGPQFLEDLQAVFWEVAMCSYDPWRRWKFNLAPWRSKEARNFVDTHDRCWPGLPSLPACLASWCASHPLKCVRWEFDLASQRCREARPL